MSKQTWPIIWLKIGPLMIITNWHDPLPRIGLKYSTTRKRETYFSSSIWCKKLLGPFYWSKRFDAEVIKNTDDVTHPNFHLTERGKQMQAEFDEWYNKEKK